MGQINNAGLSQIQNNRHPARELSKPEIELGGYRSASTSNERVHSPSRMKNKISSAATPIARKIIQEYPDVREPVKDKSPRNIVRFLCALQDWSLGHENIGNGEIGTIYNPSHVLATHKGADPSYACFFASILRSYSIGFRIVCFYQDPDWPEYITEIKIGKKVIDEFENYRDQFCRDHGVKTTYDTKDGNDWQAPLLPESDFDNSLEYTEKNNLFYTPLDLWSNIPGTYPSMEGCEKSPTEHSFCDGGGVVLRAEGELL